MEYCQTKIKRARKDYFCEKCLSIIPKGTDYVDCLEKTDFGWKHNRYHKDCDYIKQGDTVIDRIFNRLKCEGQFTAAYNGEKVIIQGIVFDHNNKPFIVCRTWEERTVYYETIKDIKKYVDWKGDAL